MRSLQEVGHLLYEVSHLMYEVGQQIFADSHQGVGQAEHKSRPKVL